jgi:hypothetical protein
VRECALRYRAADESGKEKEVESSGPVAAVAGTLRRGGPIIAPLSSRESEGTLGFMLSYAKCQQIIS